MKHSYKITMPTRDIFNISVALLIRQYDPNPEIFKIHDESGEYQLVDVGVYCTAREALILKATLADYILDMTRIGKESGILERMASIWNQNTTSLLF